MAEDAAEQPLSAATTARRYVGYPSRTPEQFGGSAMGQNRKLGMSKLGFRIAPKNSRSDGGIRSET